VLRFLPLLLTASRAFAGTASLTVEIRENRSAVITEHFSQPVKELVFLLSPCARIENVRVSDANQPTPAGPGPWITLPLPNAVDVSYEAVPLQANPKTCPIPLLIPKQALDSVSLAIEDRSGTVGDISLPHVVRTEPGRWSTTLPAIPSKIQIEWRTGETPTPRPEESPTGLFFWNFGGLVTVLVSWTILYLLWARAS
jgi:hypothetical protein